MFSDVAASGDFPDSGGGVRAAGRRGVLDVGDMVQIKVGTLFFKLLTFLLTLRLAAYPVTVIVTSSTGHASPQPSMRSRLRKEG